MKGPVFFSLSLILTLFTGCQRQGSDRMYSMGGRMHYNVSAQSTIHQEVLLNIVRLRYSEPPFFVGNELVTYHPEAQRGIVSSVKNLVMGPGARFEDASGISYAPLKGKNFSDRFMMPIDPLIIGKLIQYGWDAEQVLRLFVKEIGGISNVTSRSGPIPRKASNHAPFLALSRLLQKTHLQEQLAVIVFAEDKESGEEGGASESEKGAQTFQIALPPNVEESNELSEFLTISRKRRTRNEFNLPCQEEGGFMTRSLLEALRYMSLGVLVPAAHKDAGAVVITRDDEGNHFDWETEVGDLIKIHSSLSYPSNPFVAIRHRGFWFYIDDHDLNSKETFSLLQHVYMHQVD